MLCLFVVSLVIVLFSFDSSVTTALKCFLCIGLFLSVYLFKGQGFPSMLTMRRAREGLTVPVLTPFMPGVAPTLRFDQFATRVTRVPTTRQAVTI